MTAAQVQRDRLGALESLRERWGGTIVLKGSGTLVGGAAGPPWVIPTGNPGMATAGMGDALTGVTAGLSRRRAREFPRQTSPPPPLSCTAPPAMRRPAAASGASSPATCIGQLRPWLNP